MKTRNVVLIAVAGAIGGLVALAATVAGFFHLAANGIGRRAPTDEEKKLLVTAQRISAFIDVEPNCERLSATRGLAGAQQIEVDYGCEEDSQLSYTSSAEIAKNARDARESFALGVGAYRIGARIGGVTVHPASALLRIGDENFAAELRRDGKAVGNVFVVRQGRIVLSLFLVGLYFDNADDAKSLMQPLLEEAAKR